jgi:DMSO/TMAO reductase YedYZ molybdopterin-dependent catalytic subunit
MPDLAEYPQVSLDAALFCRKALRKRADYTAGTWRGVALHDLLVESGIHTNACSVRISGHGGSVMLTLDDACSALLATHIDEQPLTTSQGNPLRLVVPSAWACECVRGVTRIEVISQAAAPLETPLFSAITDAAYHGSALDLRGIAYAGGHPVRRVEISVDHSAPYPVDVHANAYGVFTWSLMWDGLPDGSHVVTAHAISADERSETTPATRIMQAMP